MKYEGAIEDLQTVVTGMGRNITSCAGKGNMYQIKTKEGETLNLFPNGTLQVQGSPAIKQKFEADFDHYNGVASALATPAFVATSAEGIPAVVAASPKQVFIVHGHDDAAREQLELVLHKLGLDPYVLANTGGHGLTIIEALEAKIGKNASTAFGIVLMTPDDMGYALSKGQDAVQPRARQNVVLEMGMLISSIGRRNMAILVKGYIEKPSDADGILYIAFNNHVKEAVPRLANRLKESGFILSPDKITHASS